MQKKTHRPVTFEITEKTRVALDDWFTQADIRHDGYIFKSRLHGSAHIITRTYARIVEGWVESIGLDAADYGTHSMRRAKASLLYKTRHGLREIKILLGHKKIESTAHYLGITVEDALESLEYLDL
jgi:integrase